MIPEPERPTLDGPGADRAGELVETKNTPGPQQVAAPVSEHLAATIALARNIESMRFAIHHGGNHAELVNVFAQLESAVAAVLPALIRAAT